MQLHQFLRAVLPALREGERFARFTTVDEVAPVGHNYPVNQGYDSVEALAAGIMHADRQGKGVWFGLATFGPDTNDKGRLARTAANTRRMKVYVVDVDCGEGKDYLTADDAMLDIAELEHILHLPASIKVCSGYGVHLYWVLDYPAAIEDWLPLAQRFKNALVTSGVVAIDPKITDDAARVMRPVGTHNKKRGGMAPVFVLGGAKAIYSMWQMQDAVELLEQVAGIKPDLLALPPGRPARKKLNSDLDYTPDFPKVSGHAVAEQCQQIRLFRDTGSAGNYEHWFASVGVIKHSLEGEPLVHKWSAVAEGYSEDETQQKLDSSFKQGPALCESFKACRPDGCKGCRFAGKIKTPLQAGNFGETPVSSYAPEVKEAQEGEGFAVVDEEVKAEVDAAPIISIDGEPYLRMEGGELERVWCAKFPIAEDTYFEMDAVNHVVRFKFMEDAKKKKKGGTQGTSTDAEGGDEELVPAMDIVSTCLIYPLRELSTNEGAVLQLAMKTKAAKRFSYMQLPVALINESGARFRQALGASGVALHKRQGELMGILMTQIMQKMGMERESDRLTRQYGWQQQTGNASNDMRAGFAYGDHLFSHNGRSVIKLNATMDSGLVTGLGVGTMAGTLDGWKAAAACYNGEQWVTLQSPILFALAAPLVQHIPRLNGSLINYFSPESGVGKTTAIQVALAIYGNPMTLTKRGVDGITENAACAFMAGCGSVPMLLDEIGNTESGRASHIIHAAASGKERDRCDRHGNVITGRRWFTPIFASSNESILDKLAEAKASAAAEMVRTFEVRVPKIITRADIEARKALDGVFSNYGHVGLLWIPYVMENMTTMLAEIAAEEAEMAERWHMLNEERFHQSLLAAYMVAYRHARKLNLIQFEEVPVMNFAYELLARSRAVRRATIKSPMQLLTDFIHLNVASALILDRRPLRQGYPAVYDKPVILREPSSNGFNMTLMQNNHKGGHGMREVYLNESALKAWFRKNSMSFDTLISELCVLCGKTEDQLRDPATRTPVSLHRIEMAPGTKYASGGTRCLYMNIDAPEFRALIDVNHTVLSDNVVLLRRALDDAPDIAQGDDDAADAT